MFFSILIPAYNVEKYIEECLLSIVNQTETDWEVIIIDDGSKDNTLDLCNQFARYYKNKKIIIKHKENEGLLMARRDAIDMASGEYIVFIDSDDYFYSNTALEDIRRTIERKNVDIVLYNAELIENGESVGRMNPDSFFDEDKFIKKDFIYENLMVTRCTFAAMCTKCCRKEILNTNIDYKKFGKLNYGEDLLQSLEIYTYADSVYYIKKPIYAYRIGSGMTSTYNPNIYYDFKKIYEEIKKYRNIWNIDKFELNLGINYINFCYASIRQMTKSKIDIVAKKQINVIKNDADLKLYFKKYNKQIFELNKKEWGVLKFLCIFPTIITYTALKFINK